MRKFLTTTDAETSLASSWKDDDQRQVERVTSRTAVEVENEIPCLEAGEEVDVGEPTVVEDQRSDPQSAQQSVSQPAPTVRMGGSSGSGTRSGVGSRACETNTDYREAKRVRVAESRGQKSRRGCGRTGSGS